MSEKINNVTCLKCKKIYIEDIQNLGDQNINSLYFDGDSTIVDSECPHCNFTNKVEIFLSIERSFYR